MRQLLLLVFLATFPAAGLAQTSSSSLKVGAELRHTATAPNGARMLYVTHDDDTTWASCVDVKSGAKMWSRPLGEFAQYRVVRFVNNDTVLAGNENRYEFLNAGTGAVIATLPISAASWDDLEWDAKADEGADTLQPLVENGIGVFYFEESFQVLDLQKLTLVRQVDVPVRKVKYYRWENVLMINPISGVDTFYFLDTRERKVLYTASKYDTPMNSSLYQPFAVSFAELLLFNEREIQSIDYATGKVNATIAVDPDDPEYYTPVIYDKALYLMISDDGVQKMYRTKDAQLLWQTPQDSVPGIVEQVIELPNDEVLLMAYEPDGRMKVHKINVKTGARLWSRLMFVQDGELKPGHKEGSRFWATVGTIAVAMAKSYLRSQFRISASSRTYGMRTGTEYEPFAHARRREYEEDMRFNNSLYSSWVNKKKASNGYATVVRREDNQVTFALAGKIYPPTDDGSAREYTGEAMMTLNLVDGSIVDNRRFQMFSQAEYSNFNACTDMKVYKLDSAQVFVGVHDAYVLRGGDLEQLSFGADNVSLINVGVNEVTVRVEDVDGEQFDFVRLNVAGRTTKRYLVARSSVANITFFDSAEVATTVRFTEDGIEAYPFMDITGGDVTFGAPRWRLSEDELDELDLGDLDNTVAANNRYQGISIVGGDVVLMGEAGLGFVSADGSCRWSKEWDPEPLAIRLGVTRIGNLLTYSMGDVTAVYGTTCPSRTIAVHEISASDVSVSKTESGDILVLDRDEGHVYMYRAH